VLAGNTNHYDGVIAAFEALDLAVVPVFASGLDCRPAINEFLVDNGSCTVDALVSLTGFSLVGGPAYNDSEAATELLRQLNVPYVSALALEFQSIDQWRAGERGLLPLETMMMVAIPELDGATGTMIYGGRDDAKGPDLQSDPERAGALAARVAAMVSLRKQSKRARKLAVVLYDFPPNSGSTGSAAYLSVFRSLFNVLRALAADGYDVEVPDSVEALRSRILEGNAATFGTPANVCARVTTDCHVAREAHLAEIEAQWGAAPGRLQTDGQSLLVLGEQFGSVFVGVQPAFGYEGDPMKLMFQQGLAPTHAFSAFYQYIRHDFDADALLHFGMHGAMEFMPGKQVGMSGDCWPERLVGSLPHVYLYAANNPSEAAIAKRRANATTVSYITPMVAKAGLYKDLQTLKDALEQLRANAAPAKCKAVLNEVQALAVQLELVASEDPLWTDPEQVAITLTAKLLELENALIPHGLHVLGETPPQLALEQMLEAAAAADGEAVLPEGVIAHIAAGASSSDVEAQRAGLGEAEQALYEKLLTMRSGLVENAEIPALLRALDAQFIAPVAGGDLIRNAEILPTGRNVHGFDPTRLPSTSAISEGHRQAHTLLESASNSVGTLPRRLAMVLWGTDNLKNEGVGIAEAMALLGTRPRFDSYGRLAGAELISLEELGRPRVDVVVTVSGIFRDLLPRQMQLLAEAACLCALADEPVAQNPIRDMALRCAQTLDVSLEVAALRVFGNDESAYGANVNMMVDNGMWQSEEELGAMFMQRRCFAYGQNGVPTPQAQLLEALLAEVDITFQNLDSLELGITTLDHYVDSLGGISRAVENARGDAVPALVGDYTQGEGAVRTLTDQVALEGRTRMLNPSWYESMLEHGYEGVHQIEAHFTNMLGWSATTSQVDPWIYSELSKTYLLDTAMRNRLAALNPLASVKMAQRMLEANERNYWSPDADTLEALRQAGDALEDQLEGVHDSLGTPSEAYA
ncbi:MAG: magnesium chelatase subunit H, partial [Pseudomonadales bacterium]